jgi:hypothetical protein
MVSDGAKNQKQESAMPLSPRREYILACLKAAQPSSRWTEDEAWNSIKETFEELGARPQLKRDQKLWADRYVFRLGVTYAHHTGAMPGFTNCEAETRFERFARAIMVDDGIEISRNLVKAAIRRLRARQNAEFLASLEAMKDDSAAA